MRWHPCTSYNFGKLDPVLLPIHACHDDVIKWKHLPHYWPFVRGIHQSLVNSPHKGQWRGALMFSLICTWINNWVNNREAGDLKCHCTHYDVTVMIVQLYWKFTFWQYLSHLQWSYLQLGRTRYFCNFYFEATTEYINAPCSLKIYGWSSKWTTPYRVIDIMSELADGIFNDSTTLLSKTSYT